MKGYDEKLRYIKGKKGRVHHRRSHEWVLCRESESNEITGKLKEIVEWCYEHWDDDPHGLLEFYLKYKNGWCLDIRTNNRLKYEKGANPEWKSSKIRGMDFSIITHNDGWAAHFKLTWGDFIK